MSVRCPECGKKGYSGPLIHGLTRREWDIAIGVYDGLSYKEIANRLGLADKTVKHYAMSMHRKWQLKSKSQVILKVSALKKLDSLKNI